MHLSLKVNIQIKKNELPPRVKRADENFTAAAATTYINLKAWRRMAIRVPCRYATSKNRDSSKEL